MFFTSWASFGGEEEEEEGEGEEEGGEEVKEKVSCAFVALIFFSGVDSTIRASSYIVQLKSVRLVLRIAFE